MAQQKEARVVHVVDLSETTRVVELEPAKPLDFVGGQYLIVNSGIQLPDGKLAKRAYSILSADERQERLVVAVRRLDGPGSRWMHERAVGDVLQFSGPWGKWLADDARPRRDAGAGHRHRHHGGHRARCAGGASRRSAPTAELLVARRGRRATSCRAAFVEAALPAGCACDRDQLPPVGHPERLGGGRGDLRAR